MFYWKLVTSIIVLSLSGLAVAKDLGTYGETFNIEEQDLLLVIEKKLSALEQSGELNAFNEKSQKAISAQVKRPRPVEGILKVSKESTRKFDPSTELEEDIIVPEGNTVNILYARGTKINPLDYENFNNTLLFIDGDDEKQTMFARNLAETNHALTIILTSGEPGLKEIEGKQYFYYFDQHGIYSKRFGIALTPSIVYQEGSEKVLTIREVLL